MARLHISQDNTGFWQMSFEDDDGALTLISHGFPAPDHLIEDARQLVEKGKVPGAAIVIGPPRAPATTAHAQARREYSKPAPSKGGGMMDSIFWLADGGGRDRETPPLLVRWIRTQSPALIIYGGDIYNKGSDAEFSLFFEQLGRNAELVCHVAGNHDWDSPSDAPFPDRTPLGYERFWSRFPPPASQQPIAQNKRGGARYEHVKDLGDWRLVFVDTGPCNDERWPVGDPARAAWLRQVLAERPGRAKIVFAHHSRLSRGKHGDNDTVVGLWECLFDNTGAPLAVLTVGGHDHNVTWYDPRPKLDPDKHTVSIDEGIHVHVNGAGGHGHDETSGVFTGFLQPISGTKPQFADDDNWCVTRIDLVAARALDVSIMSFGTQDPPAVTQPALLKKFEVRF